MADNGPLRRGFADVHKAQGSPVADEAARRITGLYAIEKMARGLAPGKRVDIRLPKQDPSSRASRYGSTPN